MPRQPRPPLPRMSCARPGRRGKCPRPGPDRYEYRRQIADTKPKIRAAHQERKAGRSVGNQRPIQACESSGRYGPETGDRVDPFIEMGKARHSNPQSRATAPIIVRNPTMTSCKKTPGGAEAVRAGAMPGDFTEAIHPGKPKRPANSLDPGRFA